MSNEQGNSDWHRVDVICHVAFKADFVAEVYCTKTTLMDIMAMLG